MIGKTSTGPRMTITMQLVLWVMLANPEREMYGLEICQEAGLPSGTVHPILARLAGLGWADSRWEDADPRHEGRPRRRYYKLTANGTGHARNALTQAPTSATVLRLAPGTTGRPALPRDSAHGHK